VTFSNEFLKDFVHHALKCGGGVGKAKEHDKGFKESAIGAERRFPLVSFDAHIGVPPPYIKLGENACTLELINELAYEGECYSPSARTGHQTCQSAERENVHTQTPKSKAPHESARRFPDRVEGYTGVYIQGPFA
jgi:hypothetical protein